MSVAGVAEIRCHWFLLIILCEDKCMKLAILFADGCEEIEGLTVVDLARRAGIEIDGISIKEESKPVDEAAIRAAIEDRDYEFVSLEG